MTAKSETSGFRGVGYTTITWVPLFETEVVEKAVKEIASLKYDGFETFGTVIEKFEQQPGGFQRVVDTYEIPLVAAYLFSGLIEPATAAQDIETNLRWAKMAKAAGADVVVIGGLDRNRAYGADDYRFMAQTLGEIGKRCLDIGVRACFHPHTGTPVETRDEIDLLFKFADPELVFFAPDTGQILEKGGSDAVAAVREYASRIKHVHLKDFSGNPITRRDGKEVDSTGYLEYVPLGDGVVDIPEILRILKAAEFDGWLNVELDGTPEAPIAPLLAARKSKKYLDRLLARTPQFHTQE